MPYRETHGHMRSRYRSGPWRLQRGGSLRRRIDSIRFAALLTPSPCRAEGHPALPDGVPSISFMFHFIIRSPYL